MREKRISIHTKTNAKIDFDRFFEQTNDVNNTRQANHMATIRISICKFLVEFLIKTDFTSIFRCVIKPNESMLTLKRANVKGKINNPHNRLLYFFRPLFGVWMQRVGYSVFHCNHWNAFTINSTTNLSRYHCTTKNTCFWKFWFRSTFD